MPIVEHKDQIEKLFDEIKFRGENEIIDLLDSLNNLSLKSENWKKISKYQRTLLKLLSNENETIQNVTAEILSHCAGSSTKHTVQEVEIEGFQVSIRQETDCFENGMGWKLWDSSFILSKWICENTKMFEGKKVLELGSGCGLTGIVAAKFAAKTTFSDHIPALVENLKHNINLNSPLNETDAVILDWNEIDDVASLPAEPLSFDIIIGSDVVNSRYDGVNAPKLSRVVSTFLSKNKGSFAVFVVPTVRKNAKQFVDVMDTTEFTKEVSTVNYPNDEETAKQFYFCKYEV